MKQVVVRMRGLSAVAAVTFALSGCATNPAGDTSMHSGSSAPSQAGQEIVVSIHEEADVNRAARDDFEAGVQALNKAENEKAIELFSKVVKNAPGFTAPWVDLAMAYENSGNLTGAEESLKQALKLHPDHPAANNEYGLVYRKSGRFAEAKSTYERILASYPDFVPARKNLGVLCDIYLRDYECALKNYRLYSAAVPDDKQAKLWIADLEARLGKAAAQ